MKEAFSQINKIVAEIDNKNFTDLSDTFKDFKDKPFALHYSIYDADEFNVICNANPKSSLTIVLTPGEWEILVDENSAGVIPIKTVSDTVVIPPSSGMVLKKK